MKTAGLRAFVKRRLASPLDEVLLYLAGRVRYRERLAPWPHASFGAHTYGGEVFWHDGDPPVKVTVGDYCSIADGVMLMVGGNHTPSWASTYPFRIMFELPGAFEDGQPASKGDITVGNDVWIGRDALVLSGVTIGDGAVVAARAVVTRDVAPYTIVAGVPARPIRSRFPQEQVAELLTLKWWEWPEAELLSIVDLLNGADVEDLIAYGRRRSTQAVPAASHQGYGSPPQSR